MQPRLTSETLKDLGCTANTPDRKRFPTPGQAWAYERGFYDFPQWIEDGDEYRAGYMAAEKRAQMAEDEKIERQRERAEE